MAVVSSIVSCAAKSLRPNPPSRRRDIASPYTPLRAANSSAPPNAEPIDPPAPITLTAENCDAPVKTNNDNAQVCKTLEPAATEPTPKEKPKTPTAALNVRQATMAGRNEASFHHGR